MAGETPTDKSELIAELARTRARLSKSSADLARSFDVSERAKESFRSHRGIWIGTMAVAGVILAKIVMRKKAVTSVATASKAGLALGAAKIAWNFARPAIIAFATKRLGGLAQNYFAKHHSDNPPT